MNLNYFRTITFSNLQFQILDLLLFSLQQIQKSCDYYIEIQEKKQICSHTNVLNNLNIDLGIINVQQDENISYSLTLNARKILNCNISIQATTQPKQFSLTQALDTQEIYGLSYKLKFQGNGDKLNIICPVVRKCIQISDSLIVLDVQQTTTVNLFQKVQQELQFFNSILMTQEQIKVQQFYIVEEAQKLNCSQSQLVFDIKSIDGVSDTYYSLGHTLQDVEISKTQYFGNIQVDNCYLASYQTNNIILKDNLYNITVIESSFATQEAFTSSNVSSATLNNATGNINMSFISWTGNNQQYQQLDNFNAYNNIDIFSSTPQLDQHLFNNSIINLQSTQIPYNSKIYSLSTEKDKFYNITIQGNIQSSNLNNFTISLLTQKQGDVIFEHLYFKQNISLKGNNQELQLLTQSVNINSQYNKIKNIYIDFDIDMEGKYNGLVKTFSVQSTTLQISNVNISHQQVIVGAYSSLFIYQIVNSLNNASISASVTIQNIDVDIKQINIDQQGNLSVFIGYQGYTYIKFNNNKIQYNLTANNYMNNVLFINGPQVTIQQMQNNIFNVNYTFKNLIKYGSIFSQIGKNMNCSNNTINLFLDYIPYNKGVQQHEFSFNVSNTCTTDGMDESILRYVVTTSTNPGSIYDIYNDQYFQGLGQIELNETLGNQQIIINTYLQSDSSGECGTQLLSNYVDSCALAISEQDYELYTLSKVTCFGGKSIVSDKNEDIEFYKNFNLTAQCKTQNQISYQSCKEFSQNDDTQQIAKTFE